MTESSVWLPKGEPGDKGPDGDPGPQGPQGPVGPPGPGAEEFSEFKALLESPDGAASLGARLPTGGSTTIQNILNSVRPTTKMFGAIADGNSHPLSEEFGTLAAAQVKFPAATSLTDEIDWAAFQLLLDSNLPYAEISDGHHILNKGNTRDTSIHLTGSQAAILDYSGAGTMGGLVIQGSITQIGDLGANVNRWARTLTFAAPPALTPEQVFILYNPTDGSWLSDRAPYREGEYFKVHSISGNNALVYGNSSSNYLAANMDVYSMDTVEVVASGFTVIPSDTYSIAAIKVMLATRVRMDNIYAKDVTLYTGIEVERCYDVKIQGADAFNRSPVVGDEYGITVSNCQEVEVFGSVLGASRHALALGGADVVCCVPNRNIKAFGLHVLNVDITNDIGAGDMHGNVDNITYDNCSFHNGVIMQGRDVTVQNSDVYGVSSVSGEAFYGTEVYGGNYRIINNRIHSAGNGASFGIAHISPGVSQKQALTLEVKGNTFRLPNATASTKPVFLRGRSAPFPCNLDMDDNKILEATTLQSYAFCDDSLETSLNSSYIIVDNVYGPAGVPLLYPVSDIANVPTRQMRQSGAINISSTASQINAAVAQAFRYQYSKMPNAQVSISSQSGAAQALIGSVAPIPSIYELTANSIRPAMVAPSGAFAGGSTARLHWEVAINDI